MRQVEHNVEQEAAFDLAAVEGCWRLLKAVEVFAMDNSLNGTSVQGLLSHTICDQFYENWTISPGLNNWHMAKNCDNFLTSLRNTSLSDSN